MSETEKDAIRQHVRQWYASTAQSQGTGCCSSSCCNTGASDPSQAAMALGYSQEETQDVPDGSNMGLGCGNPQAIAALKPGETVLDLGSGGGFDCFLAAPRVGENGRVIGVDMTPEMVSKARDNAGKAGTTNVEFRLGEIEHLPVADQTVDVIISNCVINLSPDKAQVFREACRVLRDGGRLAISDIVAVKPLPDSLKQDMATHCGCVAGAAQVCDLERMLREAGFEKVTIELKPESKVFIKDWFPDTGCEDYVISASIEAIKMPGHTIADTASTDTICYCKGVSKTTIVQAIQAGGDTLKAIKQATGAGTGTECKTKNPSGHCCAGDIETLIARYSKSPLNANEPGKDES